MTINGGGISLLLQFHPKTKTEEMSHFVRHDDKWKREKVPSSNSTQKRLYVFGEKLERGRSPRSNIGDFSLRSTWHNKKSFWEIRRRSFASLRTTLRVD